MTSTDMQMLKKAAAAGQTRATRNVKGVLQEEHRWRQMEVWMHTKG